MTTIRQIERCWNAKSYARLFNDLVAARPEGAFRLRPDDARAPVAAAMAVVRLEELNQSHAPLYGKLVRAILAAQEADGGWGDPVATAVCLRALTCGGGHGVAVENGLKYLAHLQKKEGIWPTVPLRRMPADPHASAFVLYQLGGSAPFRRAVRFDDAVAWFDTHATELDMDTRTLWDRAWIRCRLRATEPQPALAWANVA